MTTQTGVPRAPSLHTTWWKAPLVASLPGLPLLFWEYSLCRAHSEIWQVLYWAMGLFAIAWALPRRRSLRTLRVVAATLALGCTLLPAFLLLLLAVLVVAGN
ncbi:hypothetical protein [Streptomyces sp. NPDC059215]|uniref:hypothetical protein n=1 Tax=Streptomyces sp. NPDC059215 TaxID=3346772 RepID=UPI003688F8E7